MGEEVACPFQSCRNILERPLCPSAAPPPQKVSPPPVLLGVARLGKMKIRPTIRRLARPSVRIDFFVFPTPFLNGAFRKICQFPDFVRNKICLVLKALSFATRILARGIDFFPLLREALRTAYAERPLAKKVAITVLLV